MSESRFSYVPVANVPFRIRFPHWLLRLHTVHVFAVVKYVGCFVLRTDPTKHRKNLHLPYKYAAKAQNKVVPYHVSEKELFLFSIHGSHGKPLLVATRTHTHTHVWNVNILLSVVRLLLPSRFITPATLVLADVVSGGGNPLLSRSYRSYLPFVW